MGIPGQHAVIEAHAELQSRPPPPPVPPPPVEPQAPERQLALQVQAPAELLQEPLALLPLTLPEQDAVWSEKLMPLDVAEPVKLPESQLRLMEQPLCEMVQLDAWQLPERVHSPATLAQPPLPPPPPPLELQAATNPKPRQHEKTRDAMRMQLVYHQLGVR